ncbi:hypothetical protein KCU65_g6837, partial [Aureobasidium melanogenum]
MALRNFGTALLHVSYIAGGIWFGARELALHNIADSDVYKGPTESPVASPLSPPVNPSVEPLQQLTPISTIFDAPSVTTTTTEYITVTRNNGSTPVPIFHGLSSRNPYANNSFVLGAIPHVVPFFESSFGQTLTHILSLISSHHVTKAVFQATASLIGFLLYLWSILPGGKQGLNTLALALFFYALQFAYFWDPLARWFSRFFRRRDNKSPPSDDSAPSPPPSPPSSGHPGGDDNDSPPGSPQPPKDTSSTGTQTTPANTQSAETQTAGLVTEGERNCLNEVARLKGQLSSLRDELAQANADIGTRDIIIADRNITIDQYENERKSNVQDHRREMDRLQAQIYAAASSSEGESDEIKRLREAHEAQIRDLQTNHGSTVQNLESEVQSLQTEIDHLRHNNECLQNEKNALSQQSESSSGMAENANSAEERQRLERQVRDLQEEVRSHEQQQREHALEVDRAVAQACSQTLTDLDLIKRRFNQSQEEAAGLKKQLRKAQGLFAPPTPEVVELRNENATLKEALSKKEAEDAAAEEQKKLLVEAQNEREKAIADCNNKVEALESTNAGLTHQKEALVEQERAARQAEEKAKTDAEALQREIDSLEHSLSLARAGGAAAAGLQQQILDARQREEALVNEFQQRLSQAEVARHTAVRQLQADTATVQRHLRESEEQSTRRINSLEQDLLQARNAHAADVETAGNVNTRLEHELSEERKKNEEMHEQGRQLQTVRALNERYEKEGAALQRDYEALKQAYNEQAQNCAGEKSALREQAEKRLQHEKQNSEGLRRSIKDLQAKISQMEEENSRARGKISALQNEVKMRQWANDNLISANHNLANQDTLNRMSAADANQNTNNAQVPPQDDEQMEEPNTVRSPSDDEQMDNASPTTQKTPFSNLPVFPPPHSDGDLLMLSPPGRKIAPLRKRSIPKTDTTGESKDPAQEILDWCNDIPADNTTSTSGPSSRPAETPRSTPGQSPVRPIFDLQPSRPTGPNVFETVNGPTRQIITDFTNGALSNAPVLQPNHNFATGAAGHAQNPSAPGTVLDPALGGTAPPGTPGTSGPRTLTRDEEREIHRARDLESRQQSQHEERKKEAKKIQEEILRNELGNFEGVYEGNDPPDAARTSATDGNGDADMAGAPPSRFVVGSRQEHDYLRSMPDNENGRHDALYRRHNYRDPDTLDEFESPIYYSDFVQGSDAEISFLRNTMPENEDGRFDDLYRGNNYKVPDAWDEFDNPVWH